MNDMRIHSAIKITAPALLLLAALASVSCEHSDPVAIDDSVITVTAQPNPVAPGSTAIVQAHVTTAGGVPQEDVVVFFSTTNGTVTPDTDLTDSQGRAFSDFTSPTGPNATVTARSGSETGSISITVTANPPAAITFDSDDTQLTSCDELIKLGGRVTGTGGTGVGGVQVEFRVVSYNPMSISGRFNVTSLITDSNGFFGDPLQVLTFTLDQGTNCTTCRGSGTTCEIFVEAFISSVNSPDLRIDENFF